MRFVFMSKFDIYLNFHLVRANELKIEIRFGLILNELKEIFINTVCAELSGIVKINPVEMIIHCRHGNPNTGRSGSQGSGEVAGNK